MMASGSKPALSQNVLSSTAVWASMTIGGMSAKATTSRFSPPNRASSTLPVRSTITDCWENVMSFKFVTGSRPSVSRENAPTTPTAAKKARIASPVQIASAIQPAADGAVRGSTSRTGRAVRGASYTLDSGTG